MRHKPEDTWPGDTHRRAARSLEGKVLGGRYRLLSQIGEGGVAVVWRARDMRTGLLRAAKLLPANHASNERRATRLLREARVMSELRHPNIVRVHDLGTDAGGPWFIMDLLPGGSLDARIERDGRLPPQEAVRLVLEACEGLELAHARGVVHRDIKPSNLLLDADGRAVLADFGIALVEGAWSRDTRTGAALGSMLYMAPEQRLDARNVGLTADIYALGATLYNAITGEAPLELFAVGPDSPRWQVVPSALRSVLVRATSKDPEKRHADVASFVADLREALCRLKDPTTEHVVVVPTAERTMTATQGPTSLPPVPSVDDDTLYTLDEDRCVLVVDDDPVQRRVLSAWLELEGYEVLLASNGQEALELACSQAPAVVLLDLHMDGQDGFEVLRQLRSLPDPPHVVIVTADHDIESVVKAMRGGAADYLTKPLDRARVTERLREFAGTLVSDGPSADRSPSPTVFEGLVGSCPAMQELFHQVERLARRSVPVLVEGSAGTGKTHVARAIHARGPRRGGPCVVVDAASPDVDWAAALSQAAYGTLVLRNVGALSLPAQALLLTRLDVEAPRREDDTEQEPLVRVIATTREDLDVRVQMGMLLPALASRLVRHRVVVPDLKARGDDLWHLTRRMFAEYAPPSGRVSPRFTPEAEGRWNSYPWPGNVRELQAAVEHVATQLVTGGVVDLRHLPPALRTTSNTPPRLAAEG